MFLSQPEPDSQEPLSPDQERILRKFRRFSTVSTLVMMLGLASVFGVIAYRLLRDKTPTPGEITATLPKDARILSTTISDGLVVLTLEVNNAVEIRTFHVGTLAPAGRLRFAAEP
ncbi:MAG: hypothetical protein B7X99_02980 [Rhizobiales bacterium 17-65-6]|mgnify:CR=1 FL=1|nr:MAG: hypothetical protein B7Z30_03430 [Rhizobiales bacterium 12-68-15]OYX87805.1 MAG: hypothetical protein B7Y84_10555 [Azorhizobium sp. 32-67-21]OYY07579.1 MAG: hypothetical protein B7Y70_14385 [Rhizobiales bacterium 35-68-8]OZA00777.1 MAG: hypothetical protein B7X99_02980 [Rhizobiales bacterium 17-65-6]